MPQTKLISLDNLSRYDGKIKDLISSYKIAGNALAYFESSTPNTEINITGAGHVVENTIKAENNTDLYMIRFTADAEATQTTRTFNYAQNYPVLIVRRDLPINYSDGSDFTRTIHAGDYIIIKLVYDSNIMTGGVIVADHDSTIREDMTDVIGWSKRKNIADIRNFQNAYINISSSPVGGTITYVDSGVTYTYNRAAYVEANHTYVLSYERNTPASSNSRQGVITNNNGVIVQTGINTYDSTSSYITIIPNASGWLYIVSDKNATDIQMEENSVPTTYEPYHPVIGTAVEELQSGLAYTQKQLFAYNTPVFFAPNWRNNQSYNEITLKTLKPSSVGFLLTKSGIFPFQTNANGDGFIVESGVNLTITNQGNDVYRFACAGEWYTMHLFMFTWNIYADS